MTNNSKLEGLSPYDFLFTLLDSKSDIIFQIFVNMSKAGRGGTLEPKRVAPAKVSLKKQKKSVGSQGKPSPPFIPVSLSASDKDRTASSKLTNLQSNMKSKLEGTKQSRFALSILQVRNSVT